MRMDDVPRMVADALRDTGLAPERLELEITEGVLIDDSAHTLAVMRRKTEVARAAESDNEGRLGREFRREAFLLLSRIRIVEHDHQTVGVDQAHRTVAIFERMVGLRDGQAHLLKLEGALGGNAV